MGQLYIAFDVRIYRIHGRSCGKKGMERFCRYGLSNVHTCFFHGQRLALSFYTPISLTLAWRCR